MIVVYAETAYCNVCHKVGACI